MFPKPPRPEPPRKAVAMQVVRQRVTGAVDTTVIMVPTRVPPQPPALPLPPAAPAVGAAPAAPPDQGGGIQPI